MITQAACRLQIPCSDNLYKVAVIPLHRHGDIGKILRAFGYKPGECKVVEWGFLDSHGSFYNRIDAMQEAKKCKQYLIGEEKDELFSENLY